MAISLGDYLFGIQTVTQKGIKFISIESRIEIKTYYY